MISKKRALDILNKYCSEKVFYSDIHYTCESTGPYHRPLTLIWQGKPTIVNPLLATPSRRKTDVLDAQLLAHYDITGLFPSSYIPNDAVTEIKQLFNEYRRHKKHCTQFTNRINNVLTYYGNTIGSISKVTNANCRPFIEDLCAGKEIEHEGILKKPPEQICEQILFLYESFDKSKFKAESIKKCILKLIKEAEFETVEFKIKGKELLDLLTTCPGVGDLTAAMFISEIADPQRFKCAKAIVAYCGFDPSVKVSAGKVTSATVRKGNKELHSTIMRSAGVLLNHNREYFGNWGQRIYKKNTKGGWKKACAAIGRKLVTSLYYMWLRAEKFSYDKYMIYEEKIINEIIEATSLSTRVKNKLFEMDIKDVTSLNEQYKNGMLFKAGIGEKSIKEIELCLKAHRHLPKKMEN